MSTAPHDFPRPSPESPSPPGELHFTHTNGPVDEAVERLMDQVGSVRQRDLVREMILAALKAGQEGEFRADLKLMNTTLKEMRFTARVFGPYREVRKVTVFGSARTPPEHPAYRMAWELGQRLAQTGHMVITGGGPGIMEAAALGAGPERTFGVRIRLPFEEVPRKASAVSPRTITYKYFFNRKVAFLKEADAVVLFPGGFGTLDEAMETLTLVQTGKHYPLPLILVEPPGMSYWARAAEFFERELNDQGYVSPSDLGLYERVDSAAAALGCIERFYSRYHSMRCVNDKLVVRLQSPLPPQRISTLEQDFTDLLRPGGRIRLSGPLPAEADQPHLAHLPRLVIDFSRRDFARLRRLIDAVNE